MTVVDTDTGEVVARHSLAENEAVIENGLGTFVEVGERLMEIRDARQYRATHGDFDTYCRERWGMSRTQSDRLITASDVVSTLAPIGVTPQTESQARALAPLRDDPDAMAEVMDQVTDEADAVGSRVTAAKIAEKVTEKVTESTAKEPGDKPRRTPLPDAAAKAGLELRKAVERLERIVADDRFAANKEQVATQLRSHLTYVEEAMPGLVDILTSPDQQENK